MVNNSKITTLQAFLPLFVAGEDEEPTYLLDADDPEHLEVIAKARPECIWTIGSGDYPVSADMPPGEYGHEVVKGFQKANAFAYAVTELPWTTLAGVESIPQYFEAEEGETAEPMTPYRLESRIWCKAGLPPDDDEWKAAGPIIWVDDRHKMRDVTEILEEVADGITGEIIEQEDADGGTLAFITVGDSKGNLWWYRAAEVSAEDVRKEFRTSDPRNTMTVVIEGGCLNGVHVPMKLLRILHAYAGGLNVDLIDLDNEKEDKSHAEALKRLNQEPGVWF